MKERGLADPVNDKLFTAHEVAELFGVTPETVRNWINDGRIHGLKHGGRWRVTQSEITRMATSNF